MTDTKETNFLLQKTFELYDNKLETSQKRVEQNTKEIFAATILLESLVSALIEKNLIDEEDLKNKVTSVIGKLQEEQQSE